MTARRNFDPIRLQVIWSRLASVADEIATTLERTAFSLIVRDNKDYACALYDARGVMLAQSTQCTPGQAGSTPSVIAEMLACYPPETLVEGDVLVCNDPLDRRRALPGFVSRHAHFQQWRSGRVCLHLRTSHRYGWPPGVDRCPRCL